MKVLQKSDAEAYVNLLTSLEEESDFLLYEKGERVFPFHAAEKMIEQFSVQMNSVILGIEQDAKLVGHLTCIGESAKRTRHKAKVVTGILEEYQGRGIATELFTDLKKWAKDHGLHRLELTVMVHNEKAIGLYKKMGFEIEGKKIHSLKVRGQWIDEYIMALLLS